MLEQARFAAPGSSRPSFQDFGSVAVRWCSPKRRRWVITMTALVTFLLAVTVMTHEGALLTPYQKISHSYPWRPYLPNLPSIIPTRFKTPSNMTLEIENGTLDRLPSKLKKKTPNFHLLMPSEHDTDGFCRTTLSAMLQDYPSPGVVNFKMERDSAWQWELRTLNNTLQYLSNDKLVQDEDLILIVDGQQTWFQLPSDVTVTQYKRLLEDANRRLMAKYGVTEDGYQKYNQTIVFGADKLCAGDDIACRYVPHSILPTDLYGESSGHRIADAPAKFINSKMLMGPAKDLKTLYRAAIVRIQSDRSHSQTVQSIFTTIFGEQQLRRDFAKPQSVISKLKEGFRGSKNIPPSRQAVVRLQNSTRYEFSIGLDYLHTIFQPLLYCSEDELVKIKHDNSSDLSYQHPRSMYKSLSLPSVFKDLRPPFWRSDLAKHHLSPNEKTAFIDALKFDDDLDRLPGRRTPWKKIALIQNTYTGAVPAILIDGTPPMPEAAHAPMANITWDDLWYSPFRRALLRKHFRTSQSPASYHNSLVGGDRTWDTRGGIGGIWTTSTSSWLPWGEVDGVCGKLSQVKTVFNDGKGLWLNEKGDSD